MDSLRISISNNANSVAKADTYFLLSNFYKNTDTVMSRKYLEIGKRLGGKDSFTTAQYYYYEGQYYQDFNKEKAAAAYRKAIEALSKNKK
ncbi:hypothetical protein [Chryseobacterium sp. P1-3]|uniref:hypothetical protein n=1 Tax=Chryseobacterium sp. (strain P1-3) TaxID=1517683 RepID=UPI000AC2CA0E|nr:hypothetical protein [Chryseobacterium sp. P1-3]